MWSVASAPFISNNAYERQKSLRSFDGTGGTAGDYSVVLVFPFPLSNILPGVTKK